ncbi:uncharacterized protein ACJ7VT_020174 [Polymixia lowei]
MAASSVRAVVSFLGKCGNFSSNINKVTSQLSRQVLSRQICFSSALHRRNLAAAGPEKFTMEFIQQQVEEYNIGKRHLANMMGEDPENFTQEDVDVLLLTAALWTFDRASNRRGGGHAAGWRNAEEIPTQVTSTG